MTEEQAQESAQEKGFIRPLNVMERTLVNAGPMPIGVWVNIKQPEESPINLSMLRKALAITRTEHPYLRLAIDKKAMTIIESPLDEIPLTCMEVYIQGPDSDVPGSLHLMCGDQLRRATDISKTFVRVHLVVDLYRMKVAHVLLIGEHIAVDGRAFFGWADSLIKALEAVRLNPDARFEGEVYEAVDWVERVPQLEFEPKEKVPMEMMPPHTSPHAHARLPADTRISELVKQLSTYFFVELKKGTKERGLTLFGPLVVSYSCAFADYLAKFHRKRVPLNVTGSFAADFRNKLEPPVSPKYVCSIAGLFKVPLVVKADMDLWELAAAVSEDVKRGVEAREPFKMVQLLRNQDFDSIPDLYTASFILSNIGHYPFETQVGEYSILSMDAHIYGNASVPMVTVHFIEVNNKFVTTMSYGPNFFSREGMEFLLDRFYHYLEQMALEPDKLYKPTIW